MITVIIPTYNPKKHILEKALIFLKNQSLINDDWELLIIDNATPNPTYLYEFDLSWHPHARIIRENRQGLTWARIRGYEEAAGDVIVFVDDDNFLAHDYLSNIDHIFRQYPEIGVVGGCILPEFESQPEKWVEEFWGCLALRDCGNETIILKSPAKSGISLEHPNYLPVGAGMAIRKVAFDPYYRNIKQHGTGILDRTGKSLSSGGDCDINLTVLAGGWDAGYFPQLRLTHSIPAVRIGKDYLAKVSYGSSRSWPMVLGKHNICPWKPTPRWTSLPRKVKAFFTHQAWKDASSFIRWKSACGLFDGLNDLYESR